jgi:DMSO/TMAO reductase YedYZ molybdopterin-dependent catalytic subunit
MLTRRRLLEAAAAGTAFAGATSFSPRMLGAEAQTRTAGAPELSPLLPDGARAEAALESLPGKKPLIKLTYRPPNYEAPIDYLRTVITPNDEFFVRYHLADIPQVDAKVWRLSIGGNGAKGQVELDLDRLKKLPAFEVVAVCQCAGNRRGLFQPHVPGVEWGSGAMGCARWKGARLKDVLDLAGLKPEAIEIVFDGADGPVFDKTPDFVKSLPVAKAIEDSTLVAYEMNGAPLPHWNGFPARIIAPGWSATYWVKHITSIRAVTKPFDGFWMKTAYRIPVGKFPLVARFPSQESPVNTPITEMVVNSLITSPASGGQVKVGAKVTVSGIAWDGGYGVRTVEVSQDAGKTWDAAMLGENLGDFAFRPWSYSLTPRVPGTLSISARATNRIGQTQTAEIIQNPAGYNNNVIQTLTLSIT